MNDFLLQRDALIDQWTCGKLLYNGVQIGFTVEDPVREMVDSSGKWYWRSQFKIPKRTAIPSGRYQLGLHRSPRFAKLLPHVLDVPDFSYILIHAGNDVDDTEGCVITGRNRDVDMGRVWDCAPVVTRVVSIIQASDRPLFLEVRNP